MNKSEELYKNTLIITIGKISTQLISFLLLPLYTKILTATDYGVIDLINTYIALCIPVLSFQIEQGIFRFLLDSRKDEEKTSDIISNTFGFLAVICIILSIIISILYSIFKYKYSFAFLSNLITSMVLGCLMQLARGRGNTLRYAIAGFMCAILTILGNIVSLIFIKAGAYGILYSTVIANIITSFYLVASERLRQYFNICKMNISSLKEIIKYTLPLIPNVISWWIVNASDRSIVAAVLGVSSTGILTVAHKFPSLYITFYNIFNLTWTETVSLHMNDKDFPEFLSATLTKVFGFFASLCIGIIAFLPFIFSHFVNVSFYSAYYQIPIHMAAGLMNVVVGLYGAIYVGYKLTKQVAKTSIIAGTINIIIHFLLINRIGLYAAGISSFVAYTVMAIYRHFDCKKYVKINVNFRVISSTFLMMSLCFASYYSNNLIFQSFTLLIAIIYAFIINKDLLKFILIKTEKIFNHNEKGV